jgi:hypothetical protein
MQPLTPSDVRVGDDYEQVRAESRREAAALKGPRRVALGDALSLVFENRDTMRAVVEEMLRAERIDDPEEVAVDVAAVNAVAPRAGQLCAMLYLEAADPADLRSLQSALGEVQSAVFIDVGGVHIPAVTEPFPGEDEPPPAFLLSFQLADDDIKTWRSGAPVAIAVDHRSYSARTELDEEQRQLLAADL